MINCVYTQFDEFESFQKIILEKNKPGKDYLLAITDRMQICYNEYINEFDTLEQKENSDFQNDINEKNSLILCYTSQSKTFQLQRGKIFENQSIYLKALCPYCLLNKPKTLDHYISKTEFPEYSTLSKNLVPCCYDCNQKKGDSWRFDSKRRFIHFYNDTFLDKRFLYADLLFEDGNDIPKIVFSLSKPNNMSQNHFNIVSWHFEDLELFDEYSDRANAFISSEVTIIKEAYFRGDTLASINQIIIDKINNNKFGENYWQKCMYEALSNKLNEIINI